METLARTGILTVIVVVAASVGCGCSNTHALKNSWSPGQVVGAVPQPVKKVIQQSLPPPARVLSTVLQGAAKVVTQNGGLRSEEQEEPAAD